MDLESTIQKAYTTKDGKGVLIKSKQDAYKGNFFNEVRELICTYLLDESIGAKMPVYEKGKDKYGAKLSIQGTNVGMGTLKMQVLPTQRDDTPLEQEADYAVGYTPHTYEKMLVYIDNARQEEHAKKITEYINEYK